MRKGRIPPNELKEESLVSHLEEGVHISSYDSLGIARNLIMYVKNYSGKINGVSENIELILKIEFKRSMAKVL